MPKNCSECAKSLTGEVRVYEETDVALGCVVIRMKADIDRDWILCDACNTLLCHDCCAQPQSGYCDPCFDRYFVRAARSKKQIGFIG